MQFNLFEIRRIEYKIKPKHGKCKKFTRIRHLYIKRENFIRTTKNSYLFFGKKEEQLCRGNKSKNNNLEVKLCKGKLCGKLPTNLT
jgi:hypothetical protein